MNTKISSFFNKQTRSIFFGSFSTSSLLFHNKISSFCTSFNNNNEKSHTKDDDFWKNYKEKMKKRRIEGPIGSQMFQVNKTSHSWQYSARHSLLPSELLEEISSINNKDDVPFIILDVREESEHELFSFPFKNKNGAELPIINREMNEINRMYYSDLPMEKYIVIIDSIGLRSRKAAYMLAQEGFLTLYVEGGLDMLLPHIKKYGI